MCTEFNGLIAFPLTCFILNLQTNKTAKSLPCNLIFIYNIQSLAIIYKIPSVHSFKLHYFLMGGEDGGEYFYFCIYIMLFILSGKFLESNYLL